MSVSYTHLDVYKRQLLRSRKLDWLGHVRRVDDRRMGKRITDWRPVGRRIGGRTRKRWLEDVEYDLICMNMRRWKRMGNEMAEWRKVIEQAKTHARL